MADRQPYEGPTAVYRLFSREDVLLYIGAANRIEERFSTHRGTKRWWPEVARHEIEWHDKREAAERAEAVAINAERPLYNIMIPALDGSGRTTIRYDAPAIAWHRGDPHYRSRRRLQREAREHAS